MAGRRQPWRQEPGGIRRREKILRDRSLTNAEAAEKLGSTREAVRVARKLRKIFSVEHAARMAERKSIMLDRRVSDLEAAYRLKVPREKIRCMPGRRI